MPTLEFISIDVWTMIMEIGNLLILVFLMKKFLFKPVLAILAKREAEIKNTYELADTARADAQKKQEEYTRRLNDAKTEASSIVKDAAVRAQTRGEEIIDSAKATASSVLQKAEHDIEREKKQAVCAIKNDISDIALGIAGKIVSRELDESTHKELIDEFIKNIGDAS